MKTFIFIFFIAVLLNSCGTILDSTRILGKWKLTSAEFYTYNEELDSYKKITGDSTTDDATPLYASFFDGTNKDYVLNFQTETFDVLYNYNTSAGTGDPYISGSRWNVDGTDNSLNLEVRLTDASSASIWKKGMKVKNFWPLSNATTLEITLIASDTGVSSYYIPTRSGHYDAVKMKGVFIKL